MKRTWYTVLSSLLVSSLMAACGGGAADPSQASDPSISSQGREQPLAVNCAAAWNSATAYATGSQVSSSGVNYTAAFWTQNNEPSSNSGAAGSGKPWVNNGACSGGGGGGGNTGGGAVTPPSGITSGANYKLINPNSGKALDLMGCGTANGTIVNLWTDNGTGGCNGGANQVWSPRQNSDGTFNLVNPVSGKALDVAGCGTANGTTLSLWDNGVNVCQGGAGQKWAISDAGDGSYTIVNPNSGGAIDVAGCGTADGTKVALWAKGVGVCNGGAGQRWKFVPVSTSGGGGSTPVTPTGFLFSPYKDATISMNWNTNVMSTKVTGSLQTLLSALPSKTPAISWSFATGECGNENWGGIPGAAMATANVQSFVNAGKGYVLSTGGASGSFTCGSDGGFSSFINRYNSARLIGVDFDIEAGQSPAVIDSLIQRVKTAQRNYPKLRFSFTLATLGGNSPQSLGSVGVTVMNAIRSGGLTNYYVNLMVMDYGSTNAGNCTIGGNGRCNMGASANQAAINLHNYWGVPYDHIELTPMIGGNDTQDETFTLSDVTTVVNFARQNGLAGLHHWSADRDTDCGPGSASPICNSYGAAGNWGFTNRFISDLKL